MDEKSTTTEDDSAEVHTGCTPAPGGDDGGREEAVETMGPGLPSDDAAGAEQPPDADPDEEAVKPVKFTDPSGRQFVTAIPDDAPDSHADMGVPIGPPDLSELKPPADWSLQVQNGLADAGILTYKDFRRNRMAVRGVLNRVMNDQIRELEAIYRAE